MATPGEITIGTADPDVIVGTSGPDQVEAKGGNDRICGRGGDDYLDANTDNDRLSGGKGEDQLFGRRGDDELHGGSSSDILSPGRHDDRAYGGRGSRDFADYETFNDGGMVVNLSKGFATGLGKDLLVSFEGAGVGYGTDRLIGTPGDDLLGVNNYHRTIETVRGFGGNDRMVVLGGTQVHVFGDQGHDEIDFSPIAIGITLDLKEERVRYDEYNDIGSGSWVVGFENALGTDWDDVIRGDRKANGIRGFGGNDHIEGRGGDDLLNGFGPGNSRWYGRKAYLIGGKGHDTCRNGTRFSGCEVRSRPTKR
jgi:Ca2+-binding RTX toxin-like protein